MSEERQRHPDEKLLKASEHLEYEVQMLFGTAHALKTLGSGGGNDVIRNALIESFAIHARCLINFFYQGQAGKKRKGDVHKDDVFAEQFFDDGKWSPHKQSPLLAEVCQRVGKEIAHLTYARLDVTADGKQWDYVSIAKDIAEVLKAFLCSKGKRIEDSSSWQSISGLLSAPTQTSGGSTAFTSLPPRVPD